MEIWRGEYTTTLPAQVIENEYQKYPPKSALKDGIFSMTQEIEAFYTIVENSSANNSN
ncbi:1663_t:CDS:1, partial [Gigaspora margarita]